ncbi:MAG TPA: phosphatidate cytidylyltransferase [Methylomirabilota bacterium]|nr:phosphatidate cytidylyltransferase [Methylomirabilota bacterium]
MSQAQGVRLPRPVEAAGSSRLAALVRRLLSTLVLLPLFVWMVVEGPMWLFGTVMVLVGALGQWEFTGMFERAGVRTFRVIGLVGGTVLTASFALPVSERVTFTAVLLAILGIGLLRSGVSGRAAWEPVAVTLCGVCYVNWLLGYAFWLRDLDDGVEWILLLVSVTWLGETAAYLVGSTLGRHKLAPVISPRKTVEGALAQLAVSVLAALGARAWFFPALSLEGAIVVGVLLGVVGQAGDLMESAIKRSVDTKDTGRLIPGHGGMLDRMDSLLVNTPVLFYYATYGRSLGA